MNQSHLKSNNKTVALIAVSLFCLLVFLLGPNFVKAALAEEKSAAPTSAEQEPEKLDAQAILEEVLKSYFTYGRENRSDPFTPFVQKQKQTAQTSQQVADSTVVADEEVPTGMQLFEPGQLTLASIVLMQDKALAMVQDSLGQGYIIEKGTKIGRRGEVEDILPNLVIIRQWSESLSGKRKYRTIEMVLRNEGE